MSQDLQVEFLVEPFREGEPGAHVVAAIDALRDAGLSVDVGALSSTATGPVDAVASGIAEMVRASIAAGAQRLHLQVVTT
ncbi:hypothetical protein BH24ACT5_BH24ACT5_19740 [soil metagenome]